jgi:hypothetical protein
VQAQEAGTLGQRPLGIDRRVGPLPNGLERGAGELVLQENNVLFNQHLFEAKCSKNLYTFTR